jgi:hypothetical protein
VVRAALTRRCCMKLTPVETISVEAVEPFALV